MQCDWRQASNFMPTRGKEIDGKNPGTSLFREQQDQPNVNPAQEWNINPHELNGLWYIDSLTAINVDSVDASRLGTRPWWPCSGSLFRLWYNDFEAGLGFRLGRFSIISRRGSGKTKLNEESASQSLIASYRLKYLPIANLPRSPIIFLAALRSRASARRRVNAQSISVR